MSASEEMGKMSTGIYTIIGFMCRSKILIVSDSYFSIQVKEQYVKIIQYEL